MEGPNLALRVHVLARFLVPREASAMLFLSHRGRH